MESERKSNNLFFITHRHCFLPLAFHSTSHFRLYLEKSKAREFSRDFDHQGNGKILTIYKCCGRRLSDLVVQYSVSNLEEEREHNYILLSKSKFTFCYIFYI